MSYKKVGKEFDMVSTGAILLGLVAMYLYDLFSYSNIIINNKVLAFAMVGYIIFAAVKTFFVLKDKSSKFTKIIFFIVDAMAAVYLILINNVVVWPYFLLTILACSITYSYGKYYGLSIIGVGAFITFGLPSIQNFSELLHSRFIELWVIFVIQLLAWELTLQIDAEEDNISVAVNQKTEENEKLDNENKKLEKDLAGYKQLSENLEVANRKLETTNQRLNKSAAEFYTLQQISQAIATILDIKELLKFVNDVIIGVMGVNYSSVLLTDDYNKMNIKITNIYNEGALQTLNDNIDCDVLTEVAKNGTPILENNATEDRYPFVKDRGVQSLLCLPLSSKNENYGLVLVEQERSEAFDDEHLKFITAIGNQISVALENVGLYEKMQKMATTDALTKIYNRLYFNEMLSKEMAKADKDTYPMCISIFDIDHFKQFNDTYGHLFGDLVLKTIARLAKDNIREQDIVARFGGEEFVIIMPNTSMDDALKLVEALREKISNYHVKEGAITASVTASFGISCYPMHGVAEAEVLSAADTALYRAKTEGRNCVRTFEETKSKK